MVILDEVVSQQKGWQQDFVEFSGAQFVTIESVVSWLADYLKPILAIEDNGELLTLSELITYRVNLLRKNSSEDARNKLKTLSQKKKILTAKAYLSIQHIPGSRLGKSGKTIDDYRYDMLTNVVRQSSDIVVVQEKLDGSCVCAYRRDNEIFALGREGDLANESANESRRLWAGWVDCNRTRFMDLLANGERACGEWLAMAHGTRYELKHEPFVVFDIFDAENKPIGYKELQKRTEAQHFMMPKMLHVGQPCGLEEALRILGVHGHHGAIDKAEGMIWRLERNHYVLFRAKYVIPDKVDGCYLTEETGKPIIWNSQPGPDK